MYKKITVNYMYESCTYMYELDIVRESAFDPALGASIIITYPLLFSGGAASWQWEGKRHRIPALCQGERKRSSIGS